MKIAIIIPAYNEAKYIGKVIQKVKKYSSTIICVDDGSTDATAGIASTFLKDVIVHETNLGKGAALKTGCEYAFTVLKMDAVVFFDADDQHNPAELISFFEELKKKECVFGVRKMGSSAPLLRFVGNKVCSILLNILFGVYIPDIPSGFKGMSRNAYKKIEWQSRGYEVELEIAVNVAKKSIPFSVLEIEAIYHDKDKGVTLLDALQVALRLIQWKVGI